MEETDKRRLETRREYGYEMVIIAKARYVWTRSIFKQETIELRGVPWYKNFRVLSVIILVITLIFYIIWR